MTTSEIPIDPSAAPPPDAVDDHLRELDFDPAAAPDPEGPAPRTVIFDVGEVLVDETRVWSIWADLLGVSSLTFASVLGAAISQGEDHHVVFPHLAPNVEWEEFVDEHERRFGGLQDVDVYADARPCLQELGCYRLSLGSGCSSQYNHAALQSAHPKTSHLKTIR
jgi:hypothetical protein